MRVVLVTQPHLFYPRTRALRLHSLHFLDDDANRAADAKTKVDSCANDGEAKVVPDKAVTPPALLDLLPPEQQQPGHDEEHADPGEELENIYGHVEGVASCLLMRE